MNWREVKGRGRGGGERKRKVGVGFEGREWEGGGSE